MAAGSYLLYQLLHYDATKLHVVVFCFGRGFAYLFDKRTRTVTIYVGESNIGRAMINLAGSGMKGYIIIDMAIHFQEPSNDVVPSPEWGIIMLSSPNEDNFKAWTEQAEYWRRMHMHMHDVGPIPRCIFQFNEYKDRVEEIDNVLEGIDASNAVHYGMIGGVEEWPSNDAPYKLVKAVRAITQGGLEEFVNLPVCFSIESKLIGRLLEVDEENGIIFRLLKCRKELLADASERYTPNAFLRRGFVKNIMPDLNGLPPPGRRRRQRCVLQSNPEKHPSRPVALNTYRRAEVFRLWTAFSSLVHRGGRWLRCR
ncbi:retrotransposon hot spot (RHS) protein [Trypanosoma rangeli]|uniref:Retrotransposon hot spot (RHS) protein n=1 Tax=Trypanosoma rangeli TaxID=5698 RepID=A0A3R7MWQ8_TRYRA|nr:retrotransposon hot spot (RHS) protein [Trypanosoma rangeli]RNF09203.1 retrotransposon hot spot (RHS) protein [Trypanosoma rangeli]|eukprot:RNF09203.1 retrotransposon hot spot (RHS) protein [Trypanosoma rangeli]